MKRLLLSLIFVMALGACAHGGGSSSAARTLVIPNPVRHALQPIKVAPELAESSAPAVFETSLCNRMFEYNKGLMMCADSVRAILEHQQQAAVLGNAPFSLETAYEMLDAPRRVDITAQKAGDRVSLTVALLQGDKTLARFQYLLKPDASDVLERAEEAAIAVLETR
ncbi:MAG: hypothetical protein HY901_24535 [Deltaproteobacteria bacterium]|nr:hypothetical protein [Deltaproteobacteria bacterium]